MPTPIPTTLLAAQAANVAALQAELAALLAAEDEYHAALVRDELLVATSLARLVHRAGDPS